MTHERRLVVYYSRAWLTRVKDRLPQVAFFLTTGGIGIDSTFEALAELAGAEERE